MPGTESTGSPKQWQTATLPCSIDTDARLGKSNDISCSVDIRLAGLKAVIDRDASAGVGFQVGCRKVQRLGVPLPADGVQEPVRPDLFSALQRRAYFTIRSLCDGFNLLAEPEGHPLATHMVRKSLNKLAIDKIENLRSAFD